MTYMGVYFPAAAGVDSVAPPLLRVLVNGKWRTSLRAVFLEQRLGRVPRVRLELDVGRPARGGRQWLPEAALAAIGPDDVVRVEIVRGGRADWLGLGPLVLVEGAIEGPAFSYDATAEAAGYYVADGSATLLNQHVSGQHHLLDTQVIRMEGLELTFNAGGRSNRRAQPLMVGGAEQYLFASDDDAAGWTAAQAAQYLIGFYLGSGGGGSSSGGEAGIELPGWAELGRVFGSARLDDVTVEGRTLIQALDVLGRSRGVRTTVALGRRANGQVSRRLIFVGRGLGRRTSLYHQLPGERFSLSRTAMSGAEAEIDWQEALAEVAIAGDVKCYESTFELRPGWVRSLEDGEPESFVRGDNTDFAAVADVYRKWVLNESGAYCGEQFGGGDSAYDLSGLFGTSNYVRRRRRFLPTISVKSSGESYGVYVEWSCDGGASWRRYGGAVSVLREECGIYLSSNRLPAALFRAAQRDLLRFRVTATIESDERLIGRQVRRVSASSGAGLVQGRRVWLDRSREFRHRQVTSGSIFSGGASRAVDDSQRLAAEVASLMSSGRYAPCRSKITLPFFSVSYRLGDEIDGVHYRQARLERREGSHSSGPLIEVVRQVFDAGGWRTELELS